MFYKKKQQHDYVIHMLYQADFVSPEVTLKYPSQVKLCCIMQNFSSKKSWVFL